MSDADIAAAAPDKHSQNYRTAVPKLLKLNFADA
jgi:hypothetical protein